MMNIAIVGSGDIGRTLGRLWARAGHRIHFSFSRDPAKLESLAREAGNGSVAATPYDAVNKAEVVLFAVPWTAIDEAIKQIGRFSGRVVVDATNPYVDDEMHIETFAENDSSSQSVERRMSDAKVVKAFNTLRDETLWTKAGQGLGIYVASDYPVAKKTIMALVEDAGFVPVDAGTLKEGKKQEPGTERYLKEFKPDVKATRTLVGEVDLDERVPRS